MLSPIVVDHSAQPQADGISTFSWGSCLLSLSHSRQMKETRIKQYLFFLPVKCWQCFLPFLKTGSHLHLSPPNCKRKGWSVFYRNCHIVLYRFCFGITSFPRMQRGQVKKLGKIRVLYRVQVKPREREDFSPDIFHKHPNCLFICLVRTPGGLPR